MCRALGSQGQSCTCIPVAPYAHVLLCCRYDTALEKANYAALAKQQQDAAAAEHHSDEEADDLESQLARARCAI